MTDTFKTITNTKADTYLRLRNILSLAAWIVERLKALTTGQRWYYDLSNSYKDCAN